MRRSREAKVQAEGGVGCPPLGFHGCTAEVKILSEGSLQIEKLQRPSGPGLGGALCVQGRWKLDWELKLGLSSGGQREGEEGRPQWGSKWGGVFWESGGSHEAFPEDPVGDRGCWDYL